MSRDYRRALWGLIALGTAARLAVAFSTYGVAFDVDAYGIVRDALRDHPFELYDEISRWPYPPGFFPLIEIADEVARLTGLDMHDLIQLPAIAADAAIAWLVQDQLGRRGASERTRLAAVALVALGPVFFMVSGYHGQLDSLAILPAVAALVVWERLRVTSGSRALAAGALIGIGGAIKTVPLLAVVALLPSARSRREGVTLVAAALAVPLLALAPFFAAAPDGVFEDITYRGVPGVGGISLLVQPELARAWINEVDVDGTGVTWALVDYGGAVTAAAMAAVAIFLLRHRPHAVEAAALVWLAVLAFGINFFLQYMIWALPFLLMAGYVRQVALLQAALVPAIVLVYGRPWESIAAAYLYVPVALGVWAALLVWFVVLARRVAGDGRVATLRPWPPAHTPRS